MTRIVVGVDGSPASEAALHWAFGQAMATGASIHVVMSWDEHPLLSSVSETIGGAGVPPEAVEEQAHGLLDVTIAAATPDASTVTVTKEAVSGAPDDVLVAAAETADLLVVGRTTRAGLFHMGSVSTSVAKRAACPVVVVPGR